MIQVLEPPATRPITLTEIAAFLGLPESSDEPLLRIIADGAVADVERALGIGIGKSRVRLLARRLVCGRVALPYSPIDRTASISVACVDEVAGTERILSESEFVILDSLPARLLLQCAMPTATLLRAEYTGGYEKLPEDVRQLLLRTCMRRFEARSLNIQPEVIAITDDDYLAALL